jgi:hypothetical protein
MIRNKSAANELEQLLTFANQGDIETDELMSRFLQSSL